MTITREPIPAAARVAVNPEVGRLDAQLANDRRIANVLAEALNECIGLLPSIENVRPSRFRHVNSYEGCLVEGFRVSPMLFVRRVTEDGTLKAEWQTPKTSATLRS